MFRSIEVNGACYGLQTPAAFANWCASVPDDFMPAVKAPRFITHTLRLREPGVAIANFFASGVLRSGPKLGPILWQLPPTLRLDEKIMTGFLRLLPNDTRAASALARQHDGRLKARAWLRIAAARPMRHAIEIRHESFCVPEFIALLRKHKVALVCADTTAWPRLMDLTADYVYGRLHGSTELYRSGYDGVALGTWAARIGAGTSGKQMRDGTFSGRVAGNPAQRDVYVYFDNTDERRAPFDAQALMDKLGEMARHPGKRRNQLRPEALNRLDATAKETTAWPACATLGS